MTNQRGSSKIEVWIGIIGIIIGLAGLWFASDERSARVRAEEEAKRERVAKEVALADAQTARTALEEEKRRLRDKLAIFVRDYESHVLDLTNALARLTSSEVPRDQALQEVRTSADAMVSFIGTYKQVMAKLSELMDGTISALASASRASNESELARLIGILKKNVDSDLEKLRSAIEDLPK